MILSKEEVLMSQKTDGETDELSRKLLLQSTEQLEKLIDTTRQDFKVFKEGFLALHEELKKGFRELKETIQKSKKSS